MLMKTHLSLESINKLNEVKPGLILNALLEIQPKVQIHPVHLTIDNS